MPAARSDCIISITLYPPLSGPAYPAGLSLVQVPRTGLVPSLAKTTETTKETSDAHSHTRK